MTPTLIRAIRQAQHRLLGTPLNPEETIELQHAQAIEEFQLFLVRKIEMSVRLDLLLPASYFWNEAAPAVRFEVDNHSFLLLPEGKTCHLFLERAGEQILLVSLADNDEFQDRLLVAVGDALERR